MFALEDDERKFFLRSQDFEPAYLALHCRHELWGKAQAGVARLAHCMVCPRNCGVDRLARDCTTPRRLQARYRRARRDGQAQCATPRDRTRRLQHTTAEAITYPRVLRRPHRNVAATAKGPRRQSTRLAFHAETGPGIATRIPAGRSRRRRSAPRWAAKVKPLAQLRAMRRSTVRPARPTVTAALAGSWRAAR